MADARLTLRFRFDFGPMISQLRDAADQLEELQRNAEAAATDATDPSHVVKVDGILTEGDADAAREALRQMDADPYGLKAGMIVQPYTDHGESKWVFRCWGTDDGCDGWLSLDHYSEASAESARDRHVRESHPETGEPG